MNTTDSAPTASDFAIVNLAKLRNHGYDFVAACDAADATPDQVLDAATRVYFATGCDDARSLMFAFDGGND